MIPYLKMAGIKEVRCQCRGREAPRQRHGQDRRHTPVRGRRLGDALRQELEQARRTAGRGGELRHADRLSQGRRHRQRRRAISLGVSAVHHGRRRSDCRSEVALRIAAWQEGDMFRFRAACGIGNVSPHRSGAMLRVGAAATRLPWKQHAPGQSPSRLSITYRTSTAFRPGISTARSVSAPRPFSIASVPRGIVLNDFT